MMLSPPRSTLPHAYRFVTRVTGRSLPGVDKMLRLRCTLTAADHGVVGVSAVVVHLGSAVDCDQLVELVHEPASHDDPPPRYFELVASLAPAAEPATPLRGPFAAGASSDGTEYRVTGTLDPGQNRVSLPDISLRGV